MIIDFSNVNGGGGGSGYTLPVASQSTLGGIKVGQNLTIDSGGTLSADAQAVSVATTATTGVVQVGSGLSITSGGVLSADIDLSNYAEKSDLEDYATVDSLSGYVETSAMSGYVETSDLDEYVPQYAMALKNKNEENENNFMVVNYDGFLYFIEDNKNEEENIFVKVKYNADYMNIDMSIDGQADTDIVEISNGDFGFTISIDKDGNLYYANENGEDVYYDSEVVEYQYGDFTFNWDEDGTHISFSQQANMINADVLTYNYELWYCVGQETYIANEDQLGLVKIGEGIDLAEDGTISVQGGEEIGKATTYDWGTVQLGNGIGLEVNDNVIFGVSAGENYVFGNGEGVGYDPNNSRGGGMKAPLPSAYTQYDLDIYDDYENSIDFVDGGGNINLSLFLDGQDGNVVIFDCDGTRYIKIYCSSGVYYLEASTENQRGAKSLPNTATTIEFSTSSPYKDFMVQYDGNGNIEVYESYDNYDTPIAELSDVDFGESISHIQLFDNRTSMNETGIGTISINNTDYIKPYYEYDGDTVTNVGFVLRKRSCYAPY
jgi:hypothetical protein